MRIYITLIIIIAACAIVGGALKERFSVLKEGSCRCCKCGWQPCKLCADNWKSCCSGFRYDRYTFEPSEDHMSIDPLYPLMRHVQYQYDAHGNRK